MWHDARPPSPTPGGTSVPHVTHGVAVDHNGSFSPDPPVGGTPGGLTVNDPPEPTPRPTRAAISQVEPESMTAERQGQVRGNVSLQTPTPTWVPLPTATPRGTAEPAPSAAAKLAPGGAVPVATPYYPVDPAITPSGHHVRPAPSAAAKLAPGGAMPVATPYYPVDPDTHPHSGNVEPAPSAAAKPTPNSTLTTSGSHMGPPRKKMLPPVIKERKSPPRNTGVILPTPYPNGPCRRRIQPPPLSGSQVQAVMEPNRVTTPGESGRSSGNPCRVRPRDRAFIPPNLRAIRRPHRNSHSLARSGRQ